MMSSISRVSFLCRYLSKYRVYVSHTDVSESSFLLSPELYTLPPGFSIPPVQAFLSLNANFQHLAPVLYFKFHSSPIRHCYEELGLSYHQYLTDQIPALTKEDFPALPPSVFQHTQAISNTLANNTSMATPSAPSSPTIIIRKARTLSLAKRFHPLSSSLALSTVGTSDIYNLEDTLVQIKATMVARFVYLQQDITNLQSHITALTITNQAKARENRSFAIIIQYLSIHTPAQQPAPTSGNHTNQHVSRHTPVPADPTRGYLQ